MKIKDKKALESGDQFTHLDEGVQVFCETQKGYLKTLANMKLHGSNYTNYSGEDTYSSCDSFDILSLLNEDGVEGENGKVYEDLGLIVTEESTVEDVLNQLEPNKVLVK